MRTDMTARMRGDIYMRESEYKRVSRAKLRIRFSETYVMFEEGTFFSSFFWLFFFAIGRFRWYFSSFSRVTRLF
jgi:hypothetical protein